MKDYNKIYYSEIEKPKTKYPLELVMYLINRFSLKAPMEVLDVGCGRGDFLESFKELGFKVKGVDICENTVQFLVNSGYDVSICDLEMERLPYKDESFDVIFSKSFIEHLSEPHNFLNETYRVLKEKGRVIILTPDWYSQFKLFYSDFTHKRPYTKESLEKLLILHGFKNVVVEYFYQLPIVWKYPFIKFFSSIIRWLWPKHIRSKNKFIRFSVELMLLGSGVK